MRFITGPSGAKKYVEDAKTTSKTAEPSCHMPVRFRIHLSIGGAAMTAVNPNIKPVSAIIEPTPFPSARPGVPMNAAITDTKASGAVVPRLSIVAPITIFGSLVFKARFTVPSISQLALFDNRAMINAITISRPQRGKSEKMEARRFSSIK